MSGPISFKGVEEARETIMTPPGTIAIFTIKEVKFDATKNKGTYYMGVLFARKQDQFSHSFFLSEKALPRVKSLVKVATGKPIGEEDELTEEQLKMLLTGKEIALKVTAKFDDETGKAYPDLIFGGFSKSPDKISELTFSDEETAKNERAKKARAAGDISGADKPTTGTAPTGGPATPAGDDSPF